MIEVTEKAQQQFVTFFEKNEEAQRAIRIYLMEGG